MYSPASGIVKQGTEPGQALPPRRYRNLRERFRWLSGVLLGAKPGKASRESHRRRSSHDLLASRRLAVRAKNFSARSENVALGVLQVAVHFCVCASQILLRAPTPLSARREVIGL